MTEPFDPYVEWLGMRGGRRPGHHYELLGVGLFESDRAAVARAADALTARIRSIRPGPHLAEWQRLLDAVAEAKACLLDPAAKAAYDASLRGQPDAAGTHASSPVPKQAPTAPIGAAAASGVSSAFADESSPGSFPAPAPLTRRTGKPRTKPGAAQIAVYGLTLVFLLTAAFFAYKLYEQRRGATADRRAVSEVHPGAASATQAGSAQRPVPPKPAQRHGFPPDGPAQRASPQPERPSQAAKPAAEPASSQEPQPDQGPGGQFQPGTGVAQPPAGQPATTQAATPFPPVDARKQKAFEQAVAELRSSMSEHDLAAARELVRSAADNAQTPQEQSEADRLDTLLRHLEEFWKAMRRIVAGLESADVLPVGDTFVAIVEAGPEQLTIKVEGQLRTYPIDRLPSRLVHSLAATRFADDPATKVVVGTYFLVDREGDPARTRQLWQEAAQAGVGVNDLLPELGRWTASAAPGSPTGPGATGSTGVPSVPTPGLPTRPAATPVPNAQGLQQAEQAVRETYRTEYEQATNSAGKARLAKLLLEAAATEEDSDLRFVLLREAGDLAAAAGDSELAFQAIDQTAAIYRVDAPAMKGAALVAAVEHARGAAAQRAIAQHALQLTEQAMKARRLDDARQLAEMALSAARKSNNRPLMQQAAIVLQQVEEVQTQGESRRTTEQPAPPQP